MATTEDTPDQPVTVFVIMFYQLIWIYIGVTIIPH